MVTNTIFMVTFRNIMVIILVLWSLILPNAQIWKKIIDYKNNNCYT